MSEANLWDKFDKEVDTAGLAEDVKEAKENGVSYREVPHGVYEVAIDKMELVAAKSSGDPMVTVWFEVLEGEYEGSRIFYNQVITQPFQIAIIMKFLESLESGIEIAFEKYNQFGNLLMDVLEAVDGAHEYELTYSQGKKGFSNYEITQVFNLEP